MSGDLIRVGARVRRSLLFFAFVFSCAFAITPIAARGDTDIRSRVAPLLEKARALDLAHSRAWLKLGHWRSRPFGGYKSEADGPAFFLAANGKFDPSAELEATLIAFADPLAGDEKEHPQCRFMARRRWLLAALSVDSATMPQLECRFYSDWKARLGAEGASLIFASAYMENAASMFGHSFLKFHSRGNRDDRDLLNYGVSFFAQTGESTNAVFGLAGLYRGVFSLAPFHETLRNYTNLEGRDVWEYRLSLSENDIENLLDHLFELQQTYFDYFFIDENCSYQLLAAIEAARPDLVLTDGFLWPVIPADTIRSVARTPGLVVGTRARPSLATRFRRGLESLTRKQRGQIKLLVRAENKTIESLIADRDVEERAILLDGALLLADLDGEKTSPSRAHRLKVLRSQTGVAAVNRPAIPYVERPELGHDPAHIGFGLGSRQSSFQEFRFRFAYQNLLSDDTSFLPLTQLEILSLAVRNDAESTRFERLAIIDIISANPIDRFKQPISWRSLLAIERLSDRPAREAPAAVLEGGAGYALATQNRALGAFTFAKARADAGESLTLGHRAGLAVEAQLLFKPTRHLRFNAGAEARRYWLGRDEGEALIFYWLRAGISVGRGFELRIDSTRSRDQSEQSALFGFHFMI